MKSKKSFIKFFTFSSLFISLMIFGGGVNYFQNASFNNDGSGVVSLTYSAKTSEVISGNYMIGNLPFTQDKVKEYFTSDITNIIKSSIYKDKTDTSLTAVYLEIGVKNLNKISTAKGFTGVVANWIKSDTGMVMSWLFTPSNKSTNNISLYQITFTFENDIKSTTGVKTGKSVAYYVKGENMNPNGAYFTATINSDGKTNNPFIVKNASDTTKSGNKTEENKPSSCGLFGIELPLILLGGLVISKRFRSKKK